MAWDEHEAVWVRWEGHEQVYECHDYAIATDLQVYESYQGPVAPTINWTVQEDAFLYFHDGHLIGASGPIQLWNFQ